MSTPNERKNDDTEAAELKKLFEKLDKNKDGNIDFNELSQFFKESKNAPNNIKQDDKQIKILFDSMNKSRDKSLNQFDFRDFVDYINETDMKISLFFKDLDKDKNGIIDFKEIKNGFEDLGIFLSDNQIKQLMSHLDKNNSLEIDWKEWRDFFRFAPHDKFEDALRHWRTEAFINYADQSLPVDYTKNEIKNGMWWRSLLAGGVAGAVSRTCTAPLDRVRIFLQVHGSDSRQGIFGVVKNMIKEGGVTSLWRGNLINVLKITPESAIKFAAYEQIKYLMGQDGQQLPPFQKFLSGSLAGFITQTTIYPMEVLKTRLALRKTGEFDGIFGCIRKIYKQNGIKAFYRGYLMNTLGIAGVGVDLALYESMKNQYKILFPEHKQPTVVALLLMANISSTTAMFSTYPLFLIRTRMQSSTNSKDNIKSIANNILKTNGVLGFYRGSFANLAKVAPAASISYLSYEAMQNFLGIKR